MSIANLSAQQLRQAANLKETIAGLENQLTAIFGTEITVARAVAKPVKKGGMSAAGRARIAAAAKLRWAKVRAAKAKPAAVKAMTAGKAVQKPAKKKFTMSAAAKAKISAAAKARWAAKRAAQAKK